MTEIMRLRIPGGWTILDNKFYDVEPITDVSNDRIINWHEGFIKDVMWIQELVINDKGEYEIPKMNYFNIDISWLPDGDLNGRYYAKLGWCGLEGIEDVKKFESKNRYEIRNKIEAWMNDITLNYFEYHNRMKNI